VVVATAGDPLQTRLALRLEVVSAWNDPEDATVWSGTIAGLLRELRELGALAGYRDTTPWPLALRALRHWLRRTGRLSSTWTLEPEMRLLTAFSSTVARARGGGRVDGAVLPVGAIGRPVRRPFVTWSEMAPSQIAAAHPQHTGVFGYPDVSSRNLGAVLRQQLRLYQSAQSCLVVSHWAGRALVRDHGVDPGKVKVVGAGRNIDQAAPPERDWSVPRFLFVGNSWQRKNGDAVLRAFARLRREAPNAELHLVGEHPRTSEEGVVSHGRLSFTVAEERRRLQRLFASATCFVMPSWIEPFGIVYVEAAAAGVPSIGTTVGGTATSVGEGGVLIEPGDDPALLGTMRRLSDPLTAREMGARARSRAASFTWRACAERVVRAFRPLAADRLGLADFLPGS
jgi:glycosyltransferase involved in cell wall biosynthesis